MSTSDSPAIELAERGSNAAAAPNSAEQPSVYEDDVVVMVDEDGNERDGYGIILETSWDSDQSSDDEKDEDEDDEEDEEDEDHDKLPPGYVRVAWPDRVEEELHVDCLRVIDRSFLHGDVVVSRSNPQGQIGTVVDVRVLADVQFEATNGAADTVVLPRTSSKQFEHPQPYVIGRYVTKGANLGIIQNCFVDVDVAFGANPFNPKAVCTLKKPAPSVYQPRLANQEEVHEDEVGNGVYYPGLRVKAKHAAWKKAVWKVGKHESATAAGDEGTVIAVRPVEVAVEWISGEDDLVNEDEEESLLKPSEITLLGLFEDSRWQVGDHVQLDAATTQAERATVVAAHPQSSLSTEEQKEGVAADSSSSSSSSSKSAKGKKSKEPVVRDYNNAFKFAGTIIRTYTAIKVQWQDGTSSGPEFIPSLHFIARNHLLENDFLPHDYAVVSPSCRLVHVLQVDSQERMVKVRYLTKRLRQFEEGEWWEHEEDEDDEDEDEEEEEAPVPAPAPASASMRRRGAPPLPSRVDIPQASAPPAEAEGHPASSNPLIFVPPQRPPETFDENDHKEEGHEEWVSVFELRTNPQFEFCLGGAVIRVPGSLDMANEALAPDSKLGHAGQVLSMQNGQVTVMWADLTQTTLEPDQLMIVEHEDDDEDEDEEDEDEDEECEDCGEDCDGNCGCECHEDEAPEDNGQPEDDENDAKSSAPVNNTAFPSEWSSSDYWKKSDVPANAGGPNPSAPPAASSSSSTAGDKQVEATATALGNMSLASSAVALAAAHAPTVPHFDASSARAGFTYSSFDVIEAPESSSAAPPASNPSASSSSSSSHPLGLLQHKYESTPFAPLNPKAFSKRVRQEWKLLKENLPPGIHVVGYEQRMDLFKVLVVGNSETPFYCNLFQFDLHLPGDYPSSPPVMHFYSRGNRMNPNLYLDGNICLSLLNTWKGSHSTQRWDESNSNLLQLFVSLQGLVIGVAEPYYLEAGYERQMGQKLACINSHLYNETALVVSLGHLNSYLSQPLQAHPFVNVVVEHALSTLVRSEIKQLETIVAEWEKKKRAAVALKFQQQQQAAAGASSTAVGETNSTAEGQVEGQVAEVESSLDESRLLSILAKFGIRKSAEVHQPAPAAPGGAAPVSPAAPGAAANAAVVYNPSLGFVTMLARATKSLSKILDKSFDTNQKNGGSSSSSSSS